MSKAKVQMQLLCECGNNFVVLFDQEAKEFYMVCPATAAKPCVNIGTKFRIPEQYVDLEEYN